MLTLFILVLANPVILFSSGSEESQERLSRPYGSLRYFIDCEYGVFLWPWTCLGSLVFVLKLGHAKYSSSF